MVDLPDSANTSAIIVAGQNYRPGIIDTSGDADWYRVDLKRATQYGLVHKGHRVFLELRGMKGELLDYIIVASADVGGFGFSVPVSGRYFVGVRNFLDDTGPYQIKVVTEAGGDAALFATAKVGVKAGGNTNYPLDRDWFQISLQKGRGYSFDIASPYRIEFFVRDSLGRILNYDPDAASSPFLAPYTGKYFIEATSATQNADFLYSFTVK